MQNGTALRVDVPTLTEHRVHKAPEEAEADGYQRHRNENKRRHKRVVAKHQHRNAKEQEHLLDHIGNVVNKETLDLLRVTVDVLHKISRRARGDLSNRKLLNFAEQHIAQAHNKVVARNRQKVTACHADKAAQNVGKEERKNNTEKA